jgi:hypothetical protein
MSNTTMSGNELRCLNCGDSYAMAMPAPVSVVTAAMLAFAGDHKTCKPSAAGAAKLSATTPYEWIRNWDTGTSSMTIWHVMMGLPNTGRDDVPHDPADFGRCHRLLEAFPAWRARLDEMRAKPRWTPFVDAWPELEQLYVDELKNKDGRAPKLYALMQKLEGR